MRLLNTNTGKLEYFMDERQLYGQYAILSHTWGSEEVSFEEFYLESSITKEGYAKIEGAARRARAEGIGYVWCDTCCIDKRSSAELSEAINSMYRWYYEARVCYAYLSDFEPVRTLTPWLGDPLQLALEKCRWFSRGWTLQELIAPEVVVFFDKRWKTVAVKSSISEVLSNITNIDRRILVDRDQLQEASVANRMSFASSRETTRLEDRAYSLLGIFNVNMPLLYGEGSKAFQRLQEEIIRTWTRVDHSILAWDEGPNLEILESPFGLLASSPAQFASKDIISWSLPQDETFELSNKGLRITSYACSLSDYKDPKSSNEWTHHPVEESNTIILALNCSERYHEDWLIGLLLSRRKSVDIQASMLSKQLVRQNNTIYDCRRPWVRIRRSDLAHATFVRLSIARTPFYQWPCSMARLYWQSSRFVLKRALVGHWSQHGQSLQLDKLRSHHNGSGVVWGKATLAFSDDEKKYDGELFFHISVAQRDSGTVNLSVTAEQYPIGRRLLLSNKVDEDENFNENFELRLDDEGDVILSVNSRFSLAGGGHVIWIVSIIDPPGSAHSAPAQTNGAGPADGPTPV